MVHFANEKLLTAALQGHFFSNLDRAYGIVGFRRELRVGMVIPDLVVVYAESLMFLELLPRRFTYVHALIVDAVDQGVTGKEMPTVLGLRPDKSQRMLADLVAAGAISEHADSTQLRITDALRAATFESIAIESKLSNWSEAVTQAVSYTTFADNCAIAIDSNVQRPDALMQQLLVNNLGLVTVGPNHIEWVKLPRRHRPAFGIRLYIADRVLRTIEPQTTVVIEGSSPSVNMVD